MGVYQANALATCVQSDNVPRLRCPRVFMEKLITQNKQAKRNYSIEDEFEAGLVLMGSEVKSLRGGKASLDEAYVRYYANEIWLVGAHIAPYENAHRTGHDTKREKPNTCGHRRGSETPALAQAHATSRAAYGA